MTFYPTDRLALFIDGANLYSAAKGLGFDIVTDSEVRTAAFLCGEGQGRIVSALNEDHETEFLDILRQWRASHGEERDMEITTD